MATSEWDALAWWEQKMYLEGFEDEGLVQAASGTNDPTVKSEQVHQSGGTTITEREHGATFSGIPGEMSAFGLPERTL